MSAVASALAKRLQDHPSFPPLWPISPCSLYLPLRGFKVCSHAQDRSRFLTHAVDSSSTSSAPTRGTIASSSVSDQLMQGPSSTAQSFGSTSASGLTSSMSSDRRGHPVSPLSQRPWYPWSGRSSAITGDRTLSDDCEHPNYAFYFS